MEEIIREGSLRLLATESSCDVILSCPGYKLMAHKIIISIASPVLQELLQEDSAQLTVLIFPDIQPSIMSLILDYIYTGTVKLVSTQMPDFLGVANLLKLKLEEDYLKMLNTLVKESNISECQDYIDTNLKLSYAPLVMNYDSKVCDIYDDKKYKKLKKVPDLIPISIVKNKKGLFNRVFPSPWASRGEQILMDPRIDHLPCTDYMLKQYTTPLAPINDPNNNINNDYINRELNLPETNIKDITITADKLHNKEHNKHVIDSVIEPTSINAPKKIINERVNTTKRLSRLKKPTLSTDEANASEKDDTSADVNSIADIKEEQKGNKDKQFKCEDCNKSFSQLRNYKYHRSIHDGTKEFSTKCPECGKVFNDRGYLSSHMKIHRDRKEYACQHCPKRFNQRVAYNMHLRIHTGVKPHECPECGKCFSRKMLLKQHQRVHSGERPYSCAECGKTFADRSNMSLHARLHTGVKPYACTVCPKSFTKKHHLKTHMNFHTGLKPYSCQKCGLSFSQSSNMRTHYKKCILKTSTEDK